MLKTVNVTYSTQLCLEERREKIIGSQPISSCQER